MLVNIRFQVLFHSPPGVLFTFPSQYCSTIGHQVVFRLRGWSPCVPYGFHVSVRTPDTNCLLWISSTWLSHSLIDLPRSFNYPLLRVMSVLTPWNIAIPGLASSAFARRYSRNLVWFLFLCLLRCFTSAGSLPPYYLIHTGILDSSSRWFPNSEICGSMLIYSYPQLIAVSHVLRRLLMPRHSPYALFRLNFSYSMNDLHSCAFLANNFFGCLLLLISPFVQNVVFTNYTEKPCVISFLLSKITLVFSQLSVSFSFFIRFSMNIFLLTFSNVRWWAQVDSNHRPHAYQACALTTWAMSP